MTLVKFSRPYRNCMYYGNDMINRNDLLNNFMGSFENFGSVVRSEPATNIIEEPAAYLLQLAAPGYDKSDFNLRVEKNLLIISVAKKSSESEGSKVVRREFVNAGFEKRFVIGKAVDASKIEAKYSNGVLEVTLAKAEHLVPNPPKTIVVSSE